MACEGQRVGEGRVGMWAVLGEGNTRDRSFETLNSGAPFWRLVLACTPAGSECRCGGTGRPPESPWGRPGMMHANSIF